MKAILKNKLDVVSWERYVERETTQWKIKANDPSECQYEIHAEYHDNMLHVHLQSTNNPKVISRIELKGGSTVLYNQYFFEQQNENEMSDDQFKTYTQHLFNF